MGTEIKNTFSGFLTALAFCTVLALPAVFTTGCDQKEKVLDVETPGGELEVERDKSSGDVEVEINEN